MACFENPQAETSSRKKALVHLPTGQVVSSYSFLEQVLTGLGWERYHGPDPDLIQFHKQSSIDLISLPRDFSKFNSLYMYDTVVKNPGVFQVRDVMDECVKTGVPPASDADNGTTLQISHLKILKFKCGWDALPAEVITINVQTKWVADAPGKQQRPAGGQRRRLIKVTVGNL